MDSESYKRYEPLFGQWHVSKEIGKGSYGRVYEIYADDPHQGRIYSALKILHIPASEDELRTQQELQPNPQAVERYFEQQVQRIQREIQILKKCKGHPNIVGYEDHAIYQTGTGENASWDILIRMELLYPLKDVLDKPEATQYDVIRMWSDITNALVFCEKQNIIHRDIKPANILVSRDGVFKLSDFGVAKANYQGHESARTRVGTEVYMAPEVYLGSKYDKRADICSLGYVIYFYLNSKRYAYLPTDPRQEINHDVIEKAQSDRLRGLRLPAIPSVNPMVNAALETACAFDPTRRFQNAAEMQRAVSMLLGIQDLHTIYLDHHNGAPVYSQLSTGTHLQPQQKANKKKNPLLLPIIIAGVLMLLGIAVLVVGITSGGDETPVGMPAVTQSAIANNTGTQPPDMGNIGGATAQPSVTEQPEASSGRIGDAPFEVTAAPSHVQQPEETVGGDVYVAEPTPGTMLTQEQIAFSLSYVNALQADGSVIQASSGDTLPKDTIHLDFVGYAQPGLTVRLDCDGGWYADIPAREPDGSWTCRVSIEGWGPGGHNIKIMTMKDGVETGEAVDFNFDMATTNELNTLYISVHGPGHTEEGGIHFVGPEGVNVDYSTIGAKSYDRVFYFHDGSIKEETNITDSNIHISYDELSASVPSELEITVYLNNDAMLIGSVKLQAQPGSDPEPVVGTIYPFEVTVEGHIGNEDHMYYIGTDDIFVYWNAEGELDHYEILFYNAFGEVLTDGVYPYTEMRIRPDDIACEDVDYILEVWAIPTNGTRENGGICDQIFIVKQSSEPTPEPITPEPITPEPITPEPITPEPITPEPITPEPEPEVGQVSAPVITVNGSEVSEGGVYSLGENGDDNVSISWSAEGDVTGYKVRLYREEDGDVSHESNAYGPNDNVYNTINDAFVFDKIYVLEVTAIPTNGTEEDGSTSTIKLLRPAPVVGIVYEPVITVEGHESYDGSVYYVGDGNLTIRWHADGDVDHYNVYYTDGVSGDVTKISSGTSEELPNFSTGGFANDVEYIIEVVAVPVNGTEADGQYSSVTLVKPIPAPVIGTVYAPVISVTGHESFDGSVYYAGEEDIEVSWYADGELAYYNVYLLNDAGEVINSAVETSVTNITLAAANLDYDVEYIIEVVAVPVNGTEADGQRSSATIVKPAPVVGTVYAPEVSVFGSDGFDGSAYIVGESDITVSWFAEGEVDHYNIYFATESGEEVFSSTDVYYSEQMLPVSDFAEDVRYVFEVVAVPVNGTEADGQRSSVTLVKPAPVVGTVYAPEVSVFGSDGFDGSAYIVGESDITVSWFAEGEVDHYNIYFRTESGEEVFSSTDVYYSEQMLPVSGFAEDVRYVFEVVAVPVNGTEADGLRSSVTLVKPAPPPTPEPTPEPTPAPMYEIAGLIKSPAAGSEVSDLRFEAYVFTANSVSDPVFTIELVSGGSVIASHTVVPGQVYRVDDTTIMVDGAGKALDNYRDQFAGIVAMEQGYYISGAIDANGASGACTVRILATGGISPIDGVASVDITITGGSGQSIDDWYGSKSDDLEGDSYIDFGSDSLAVGLDPFGYGSLPAGSVILTGWIYAPVDWQGGAFALAGLKIDGVEYIGGKIEANGGTLNFKRELRRIDNVGLNELPVELLNHDQGGYIITADLSFLGSGQHSVSPIFQIGGDPKYIEAETIVNLDGSMMTVEEINAIIENIRAEWLNDYKILFPDPTPTPAPEGN